jgi:hypothetical protein
MYGDLPITPEFLNRLITNGWDKHWRAVAGRELTEADVVDEMQLHRLEEIHDLMEKLQHDDA